MHKHLYKNAKLRVGHLSGMILHRLYKGINDGNWPEQLGTSMDVNRDFQMASSPDDLIIIVSGNQARNHVMIGPSNGCIGFPVTKQVDVPANWAELIGSRQNRVLEPA